MAVETTTTISGLNSAWPLGTDVKAEGDNHLRLIKSVLKGSFDDSSGTLKTILPFNPPGGPFLTGYLYGLTLANNGTDNIDVAAGAAASDDASGQLIKLTALMTKKTNAAWAAGSGNGGFDGTMAANSTGHVFLIGKSSDLTAADIFISASLTPTLPSGWDRKRRIMSILRGASALTSFIQRGNRVLLTATASPFRSSTAAVTDSLVTTGVPLGLRLRPIIASLAGPAAASILVNTVIDGDLATTSGNANTQYVQSPTGSVVIDVGVWESFFTNTAGQIRFSAAVTGTVQNNQLSLLGWWDDRGING